MYLMLQKVNGYGMNPHYAGVSKFFKSCWGPPEKMTYDGNVFHSKQHETYQSTLGTRHGKRSNLSADAFCQQSKFPQKMYL